MSHTTHPASYDDRLLLAQTALTMRTEQQDGWVSDDTVLDAASEWTTDDLDFTNLDAVCETLDPDEWQALTADQERLVNDLTTFVQEQLDGQA